MVKEKFYWNAYLWMIGVLIITITGFFSSLTNKFHELSIYHHIHGISATLWLITVIVQPALYRFDNLKLHRIIGRFSVVLALSVVIGGLIMMKVMMQKKRKYGTVDIEYYIGIFDAAMLIPFILFFILGLKFRKNIQLHARYMISTAIFPLVAPTSRMLPSFGISSWEGFMTGSLIINEVIFIALIINDRINGKFRLPYLLALLLTLAFHISSYFVPQMQFWRFLMDKLI
ncbi:hypothetical protein [Mariniflexile sp.]|uniref:hypothetical protein n=1 Tax=Mariniflexile sp. TaxID=1979402 RepID=UPI0040485314